MFSALQRQILQECHAGKKEGIDRKIFLTFYKNKNIKKEDQSGIISKSLERLIDRGLLVGYGLRTPKKWFIKKVRLTRLGSKEWEKWLAGRQKKLPL